MLLERHVREVVLVEAGRHTGRKAAVGRDTRTGVVILYEPSEFFLRLVLGDRLRVDLAFFD